MRFSWPKFLRRTANARDSHDGQLSGPSELDRRQALAALSAVAGGGALSALPQSVAAQDSTPPKRALTGRDANGKSVFKSFDVTSKVVTIENALARYEREEQAVARERLDRLWREADNWTAFTNGARSWISGPCGLEDREQGWPVVA